MSPLASLTTSVWSSLFATWSAWKTRVKSAWREEKGATTLEYVIIAAIVCAAAVIVATLIVTAINNFSGKIPQSAP